MTERVLNDFCRRVGAIVGRHSVAGVPCRVADLLPALLADPALLGAAQRAMPETGYGRNLMFVCPEEAFSMIAVVWPPGISTPIHDHATWCAFGVYEGSVRETRYACIGRSGGHALAEATARADHGAGAVAHLPIGATNIHRIHNPTAAPAISIHVYGGNSVKLGPNVETVYSLAA